MKPCTGCWYLNVGPHSGTGWCDEPYTEPPVEIVDKYTGKKVLKTYNKYKYSFPRLAIGEVGAMCEQMRGEGAPCGPEARLWYSPGPGGFWKTVWRKLTRKAR